MTNRLNLLKLHFKNFFHTKFVGDSAILIAYLNSVWKNTQETLISLIVTKIMFTTVIR
jgi:hypothetical protein